MNIILYDPSFDALIVCTDTMYLDERNKISIETGFMKSFVVCDDVLMYVSDCNTIGYLFIRELLANGRLASPGLVIEKCLGFLMQAANSHLIFFKVQFTLSGIDETGRYFIWQNNSTTTGKYIYPKQECKRYFMVPPGNFNIESTVAYIESELDNEFAVGTEVITKTMIHASSNDYRISKDCNLIFLKKHCSWHISLVE